MDWVHNLILQGKSCTCNLGLGHALYKKSCALDFKFSPVLFQHQGEESSLLNKKNMYKDQSFKGAM